MSFDEIDEGTLAAMRRYFGRDPRVPILVTVECFSHSGGSQWPATEFLDKVSDAIFAMPAECVAGAVVELGRDGELRMSYRRQETNQEVAANVASGIAFAERLHAEEVAEFNRLKAKFGIMSQNQEALEWFVAGNDEIEKGGGINFKRETEHG